MENPIGKNSSDYTSTNQIPANRNADLITWEEPAYQISGKHLRTLYLRVMCMEMDEERPPISSSLGDCKVEIEDLKDQAEPALNSIWVPLDNQPDPDEDSIFDGTIILRIF